MRVYADIRQLASNSGKSYLNVQDIAGGVCVWGFVYNQPTFLLRATNGNGFWLVQFDDEEYAKEWLARHDQLEATPLFARSAEVSA